MPPEFQTFVPDPDVLLDLEPQELSRFVWTFSKHRGVTLRIGLKTSLTLRSFFMMRLSRHTPVKKGPLY